MSVSVSTTKKPLNPRAQDLSPKGYNRANIFSGKALDFDGVNDFLTTAAVPLPSAGTVCFNYKADATGGEIAECGGATDDFRITINSLCGFFTGAEYRVSTSGLWIVDGRYHFATLTWGDAGTKFYINGKLLAQNTNRPANFSNVPTTLNIGARDGNSNFLNGALAGFKIFNVGLTDAQVSDLYLNPEKIVPDGVADSALKLWLPMMEGAGTTAYDGSGNGNDGTISGATWVSGIGAPVAQTALVSWNKGTNLVPYSEDQSNWTLASNAPVTANVEANPFSGLLTADKVNPNTNNVDHYRGIQAGTYNGALTSSIYVKADGYNFIDFGIYNQTSSVYLVRAVFNLSAESINFVTGSIGSISNIGSGWYQIKITGTLGSSSSIGVYHRIRPNDGTAAYSGDGTSGAFLWGASLEQSTTAGPYVRTGATTQTSPVLLPQGLTANKDITGVNAFESARNPYALNLDGTSWAEVHDNKSLDITSVITLEAWVQIKDGMSADGVLGRWAASLGYLLYLNASNDIRFYVNGLDTRYTSLTNGWHHIVGLYNGSAKILYVDGVEVSSSSQTVGAAASTAPIEIGRYQESAGNTFDGPIALPRIYNRALTATEVARNYNADRSKFGL